MAPHGDEAHAEAAMDMSNMPGMDMGSTGSATPMTMMMAVFQNSMATPLYSSSWTPGSAGAYAGTCIFLVALAMVLRGLLAAKSVQESRWVDRELNRRLVAVQGRLPAAEQVSRDSLAKHAVLTENGVEENVMVVQRAHLGKGAHAVRPWRLSVDPVRALIDTTIAGVGYLLMLAVMTMNVGYFLSVLAGVFLGSLAVGRYIAGGEH